MEIGFAGFESSILHGLLEESSQDIVIRLDDRGFLAHASANSADIGLDLSGLLLAPHITDLVDAHHTAFVAEQVGGVLAGQPLVGWVEFPIIACQSAHHGAGARHRHNASCHRWYALSLRPVMGATGEPQGAVGLLRSVQQVRNLEGELRARTLTDPLTGLANRQSLCASLGRHLARGGGQMMAVLAVDGMRAVHLRYGQRTADDVLWGFARFVESMAPENAEIAQLDGERLGVILPCSQRQAALAWCEEVLATFGALAAATSPKGLKLTASAGLARVECTIDWTLREAELGLVMARAAGGGEVRCGALPRAGFASGTGQRRAEG
jgi:diguanylate cyclase